MHALQRRNIEFAPHRLEIDGLTTGHAGRADARRQQSHHGEPTYRLFGRLVGPTRETLEGDGLQRIARQDRGRFVERLVA